jgi:hypothetical protein
LDSSITEKEALVLYHQGNASNKSIEDFFNQRVIVYHNLRDKNLQALISTRSRWYQAEINVNMNQSIFQKYALILRNSSLATVKQWSQTPFN